MSLQTYSLTSPVFRPTQRFSERVHAVLIEYLGYFSKRLFGCWHLQMGRPMTLGTATHRACTKCGMRRDFDLNTWKMQGRYYSDPVGPIRFTRVGTSASVAVSNGQETADPSYSSWSTGREQAVSVPQFE
jgi:hypothetical protein